MISGLALFGVGLFFGAWAANYKWLMAAQTAELDLRIQAEAEAGFEELDAWRLDF